MLWSLNCHFPCIPLSTATCGSHFPEGLQNHPQQGQLLTFDNVNMQRVEYSNIETYIIVPWVSMLARDCGCD